MAEGQKKYFTSMVFKLREGQEGSFKYYGDYLFTYTYDQVLGSFAHMKALCEGNEISSRGNSAYSLDEVASIRKNLLINQTHWWGNTDHVKIIGDNEEIPSLKVVVKRMYDDGYLKQDDILKHGKY